MPALWAMAAGLPVVAEATPLMRGLIEDGTSGLLFAPGDMHAAAARLLRVHDRGPEAGRLGSAARATVARRFGVADFAARLDAVYGRCARGEPIRVPEIAPPARASARDVALACHSKP
jgi:glycosyltransferase involved in cell wall biosynthesis